RGKLLPGVSSTASKRKTPSQRGATTPVVARLNHGRSRTPACSRRRILREHHRRSEKGQAALKRTRSCQHENRSAPAASSARATENPDATHIINQKKGGPKPPSRAGTASCSSGSRSDLP